MSGEIINADRSLAQVTQGIRVLSAQTVANMCQLGKLLTEAKAMVGHGGWGKYLEEEVSYSQSTANYFMRMYDEYGEYGPNSQTIGNLGGTKAMLLLSLPAEQREQFAEDHKADSVRQFKSEIAKLTKRAEQAEAKVAQAAELMALATEENGALKQRLDGIDADYKAQLDTVDRENDALRAKLAEAESRKPELAPEDVGRIRQEGADAAMDAQREIIAAAEAKAAAVAAEKDSEIAQLRALLEKAQKEKPSNADSAEYKAFKAVFEGIPMSFIQLLQFAKTASQTPEQETANLNAVRGLLIKLGQKVGLKLTTA